MGVSERHTVPVADGTVALVLHLPSAPARVPCVIACHGLGASKDSDKYLLLGEELPRAGLALGRFDFRGCGESSGTEEETTIASRLGDRRGALGLLAGHSRLDGRFGLLGSSLGGFVALHLAAERGDGLPVVTWNAPATLEDLAEREDAQGIGQPFLLEFAQHRFAHAPEGVPRHLIIQGEADEVVPLEHATVLHATAGEPCDLVVIEGGDHRLTDMAHRRQAVAHSIEWFQRFFGADA